MLITMVIMIMIISINSNNDNEYLALDILLGGSSCPLFPVRIRI